MGLPTNYDADVGKFVGNSEQLAAATHEVNMAIVLTIADSIASRDTNSIIPTIRSSAIVLWGPKMRRSGSLQLVA